MSTSTATKAKRLKTAKEARLEFERKGLSIAAWARAHSLGKSLVYEVLAGRKKCHRGASHKAAVLLGLKAGELGVLAVDHVAPAVEVSV